MAPYIFGARGKIHIINLEKTAAAVHRRDELHLGPSRRSAASILFVGTKRSARDAVKEEAARCGMPYVAARWLGGMLTNFRTVKGVDRAPERTRDRWRPTAASRSWSSTKCCGLAREREKLDKSLGGIKDMNRLPDALFVIDIGHENIAVQGSQEARHSGHRGGRHQLRSGAGRLRDPGQRRRDPRRAAVHPRRRRRGARRQGRRPADRCRREGRVRRARRQGNPVTKEAADRDRDNRRKPAPRKAPSKRPAARRGPPPPRGPRPDRAEESPADAETPSPAE